MESWSVPLRVATFSLYEFVVITFSLLLLNKTGSAFGTKTPGSGGFGTPGAFGAQTPGSSLFGGTNTSTSGGLFGGGASTFGQTATSSTGKGEAIYGCLF